MKEIWKNVKDYENIYQVSNLGRVKRLRSFRKNGASGYYQAEKILKHVKDPQKEASFSIDFALNEEYLYRVSCKIMNKEILFIYPFAGLCST